MSEQSINLKETKRRQKTESQVLKKQEIKEKPKVTKI